MDYLNFLVLAGLFLCRQYQVAQATVYKYSLYAEHQLYPWNVICFRWAEVLFLFISSLRLAKQYFRKTTIKIPDNLRIFSDFRKEDYLFSLGNETWCHWSQSLVWMWTTKPFRQLASIPLTSPSNEHLIVRTPQRTSQKGSKKLWTGSSTEFFYYLFLCHPRSHTWSQGSVIVWM